MNRNRLPIQSDEGDGEDWDREMPEPDENDDGIDTIPCVKCGANVDEELPYCPVCGAELEPPSGGLKKVSMIFIVVLLVAMLLLGSLLWGL